VAVQVVLTAFKEVVLANVEDDVQITCGTASPAGIAFTGDAQLRPVINTGWNLELECFFTNHAAVTVAVLAFVFDDLSGAVTLAARPGDGEEALLKTDLTVSVTR
jgi:hypothetical protein